MVAWLKRMLGGDARAVPAGVEPADGVARPDAADGVRSELTAGERIYAIGDIHGCLRLLDQMHALILADLQAFPIAQAEVVYIGDYCDRGPDTAGVIGRLLEPPAGLPPAVTLKGNHEEILLDFLRDPDVLTVWRPLGGLETLASYGVDPRIVLRAHDLDGARQALMERMPRAHLGWLEGLPASYRRGPYFFCHAGVRPGVPLHQQSERDLLWIRKEFLDSATDYGLRIVHGHSPAEQPEIRRNRINIDTGAYASGHLTCVVLEAGDLRWLST